MTTNPAPKGPWTHRVLVYFFTVLFGLLIFWLLGFVLRDIGTWPGPDFNEVQTRMSEAAVVREAADIQKQIDEANRETANCKQRQSVLRDSTGNSEKTMNQLLELQKLTLQKGHTPSADEAKSLAESERLFLANQTKYQELNERISTLTEKLSELQDRLRTAQEKLNANQPAIQEEFNRLHSRHQFKLAAIKLAVLAPLLCLAVWLFFKHRGRTYAPLVHGFGLAVLLKAGLVMHEYFPRRYFKYVLIALAIALVMRILVHLLRTVAAPRLDWLLKQYREAYEHFHCPVCSHPIRRGPLKHRFWTRSSLKKLHLPATAGQEKDESYTCPVCATVLFEECGQCHHIRHSLLPACSHCGAVKNIQPVTQGKAAK